MRYLADSDVLIDALNGQDGVIDLLDERSREGFAISIISVGELYDGAVGTANFQQRLEDTDALLSRYPIVTLNRVTMLQFAQLRVDLRRQGQLIPDFDLVIAATALVYDLTLITGNQRHFQRVPGLMLEDYR